MTDHARCGSCHAEIRWGVTVDGARMPLDVEPTEHGAVYIYPKNGKLRVLTEDERERARTAGVDLYMPHHATCQGAGRHRVPRAQLGFDLGTAS